MTLAKVQIESLRPGGDGLADLFNASIDALRREPGIQFDTTGAGTVIAGNHRAVLAALRRLEEACCRTGAEEYLITVVISDSPEGQAA